MTYRNRKLLNLAKECPYCMRCGKTNDGTIVAAHSNQIKHGKGMGIKADDRMIAFLCYDCHTEIDQGKSMSKEERRDEWGFAHERTKAWAINKGVWNE